MTHIRHIIRAIILVFYFTSAGESLPLAQHPLEVCRKLNLHVPYVDMIADVIPVALKNRTLIFIGDSTMLHQFKSFMSLCKCGNVKKEPLRCEIVRLGLSMEYWPYGRLKSYKETTQKSYRASLSNRVSSLCGRDIIVANLGIHWDFQSTIGEFKEALQEFFGLIHAKERCELASENSKNIPVPIILWRETIPQHFNTSNGHYAGDNLARHYKQCAPMTAERYVGDGLKNECIPSCMYANYHNDVANKIARSICVDIIPVWDELICFHDLHLGAGDCAHMLRTEKVQVFFHWKLLLALLPTLNVPIPEQWIYDTTHKPSKAFYTYAT